MRQWWSSGRTHAGQEWAGRLWPVLPGQGAEDNYESPPSINNGHDSSSVPDGVIRVACTPDVDVGIELGFGLLCFWSPRRMAMAIVMDPEMRGEWIVWWTSWGHRIAELAKPRSSRGAASRDAVACMCRRSWSFRGRQNEGPFEHCCEDEEARCGQQALVEAVLPDGW